LCVNRNDLSVLLVDLLDFDISPVDESCIFALLKSNGFQVNYGQILELRPGVCKVRPTGPIRPI
jgi:hypothetical protein